MHTKQIPLRLSDSLLAELDVLVASGSYRSRAAAIRAAIELIIEAEHQRRIDRAVIDGYTRHPPTEAEDRAATASMREAVEEEPW